jgi:hypothetical protein
MTRWHATTWKNAFWIASILIVLVLAIDMLLFNQITQFNPNDLGLTNRLPITFWIGLSYLCALLFVGRHSKLQTIIVVILISFYLFGIPTFITENKADPTSYYWSSVGEQFTNRNTINFSTLTAINLQNWPSYFFLARFLTACSGLPAIMFASYFPMLTISLLGIITYAILKVRLNSLYSAFGALWVIGSMWIGQQYFMPQSIALLFYFTIFLLVAHLFFRKSKNTVEISLSIFLLFTALVATHLLSSFFVLIALIAVYLVSKIFLRNKKLPSFFSFATCILFVSIFLSYEFLVIQNSSSQIVKLLYLQIIERQNPLSRVALTVTGNRALGSTSLQLQVATSYAITIINVVIMALAILTMVLSLLRHKKKNMLNLFWIAWILSAGVLGLSVVYGQEALNRAFMFALLPTSYFAVTFLKKKNLILTMLLASIIFINIPAQYGQRTFSYMPSTELKGAAFYSAYAPGNESFFYEYLIPIAVNGTGAQLNILPYNYLPTSEVINKTVARAMFVISSNMQENAYQFFYGLNPLKNISLGSNQLYDNGAFQIHAR